MTGSGNGVAFRSATELAGLIRSRQIASREALEMSLDRVERLDKAVNCVVTIDAERAGEEARAAADALARAGSGGDGLGPLPGVATTVKDARAAAGMRTASGAAELAEFVPEIDPCPVDRLRRAG